MSDLTVKTKWIPEVRIDSRMNELMLEMEAEVPIVAV